MGLSRTVSEIYGDFGRISHPLYSAPPAEGVPLGIGYRRWGSENYWAEKEVWRYLQPSGYNAPTWQTDRRTDI